MADSTVAALTAAAALDGTELLYGVQSSADRKVTTAQVKTYAETVVINTQTGSYTLVLTDAGKIVQMNVAGANNLTVPPNSSVAFPVGTALDLVQIGAGQTTVVAGSGVTINSKGGNLKLTGQYSGGSLYKRATDTWVLTGDLSA